MENELIKINVNNINGEEVNCVSARELYVGLGYEVEDNNFSRWIKKQLEGVEAIENGDFILNVINDVSSKKPITDYILTVDIAKEICMVVGVAPRTTKKVKQNSKAIRKYFIECEKKLKEVVKTPKLTPQEQLALQLFNGGIDAISAHKELLAIETKELNDKIEEQKPKVEYTDNVLQAEGLLTVTVIAKDFGLSAKKLNQILVEQGIQFRQGKHWLLYAKYQDKGYTQSTTDKEGHVNTKWTQKGKKFIVELLLKLGYKLNKDIK